MRIAVCDDEKACIDSVVTVPEDYAIERRTDIDYEAFERYTDLEERIGEFDVFVMDYQTPEIDGLSFAHIIREQFGENTLVRVKSVIKARINAKKIEPIKIKLNLLLWI